MMDGANKAAPVLSKTALDMATTFLDDLGDPGAYGVELDALRLLIEAAQAGAPPPIIYDEEQERADFEAACAAVHLKVTKNKLGSYTGDFYTTFLGWKARAKKAAESPAAPAPHQEPEQPTKPGLYAIRHINNWDGQGDVMTSLATYDKDGKWRYDENGAPVIEYAGDRLLKAWPLDHVGGEALTYVAGVTAAVLAIRSIMDQFREEHSEPEPAPGTSGMSEKDLATWHVMYRLEKAVRELKEGNLVPLPPAWLNQEEDNG